MPQLIMKRLAVGRMEAHGTWRDYHLQPPELMAADDAEKCMNCLALGRTKLRVSWSGDHLRAKTNGCG